MRTVRLARGFMAVVVAALSTVVLAVPAAAGPDDPPSLEPSGPSTVRVGPGAAAPKPVRVDVRNYGRAATQVVVTLDASAVPAALTITPPGADQGCSTTGAVTRCLLAGLGHYEVHAYTFGVAATAGAPAAAEGAMVVSAAADNAPARLTARIGLVLAAADVDLVLAPVVSTPTGSWSLDPGESVDLPVRLRNDGGVAARGVVVRVDTGLGDPSLDMIQLVAAYGNCTVDAAMQHVSCAFDTVVGPGETFTIDPATPLRARISEAAPGRNSYGGGVTVNAAGAPSAKSAGRTARLIPVRAGRAADLNSYDNNQPFSIRVEGLRPAEGSAIGASVTGDIGDTKTVVVGFHNDGPAAVAAREGNGGNALVRLPAGLKVTRVCDGCWPASDANWPEPKDLRGLEYRCYTGGFILPGTTAWCWFDVTIVGRPGRPGSVRIYSGDQDRNSANDVAPIVLVGPGGGNGGSGGGLPITGAPAGITAGIGAMLLVVGVAAVLLTHRRRVHPAAAGSLLTRPGRPQ
jgi:hypothetical protein